MREELGLGTKLNRHQRKNRVRVKQDQQLGDGGDDNASSGVLSTHPRTLLLENKTYIQAIIASGTGPDGRAEARKLRKKRRMMVRSVAVMVFAVLVALAKSYYFSRGQRQPEALHSPLSTRDVLMEDNVANMLLLDNDSDATIDNSRGGDSSHGNEDSLKAAVVTTQVKESVQQDQMAESGENSDDALMKESKEQKKADDDLCANDEVSCFFMHQA